MKSDNEVIAEWMGMVQNPHDPTKWTEQQFYIFEDGQHYGIWKDLSFGSSLDWLMPVVIKLFEVLSSIDSPRDRYEYANAIRGSIERSIWDYLYSRSDLKSVCDEVVTGIKWYNTQQK